MSNIEAIKPDDFTRVRNCLNGNPRYVLHYLSLVETYTTNAYNEALFIARKQGGKPYRGKDFGGGFVFTTCNLNVLCIRLNSILGVQQSIKQYN